MVLVSSVLRYHDSKLQPKHTSEVFDLLEIAVCSQLFRSSMILIFNILLRDLELEVRLYLNHTNLLARQEVPHFVE